MQVVISEVGKESLYSLE